LGYDFRIVPLRGQAALREGLVPSLQPRPRASHIAPWLLLAAATAFAACASSESTPATGATDAGGTDASSAKDSGGSTTDASVSTDAGRSDAGSCKLVKPYATKDVACNDCAAENCCDVVNACYNDTDCDDGYVNCILACVLLPDDAGADGGGDAGVATCTAACGKQYPTGKTEYDAIDACIASSCSTACK